MEAFAYCWTDKLTNKLYVGSHRGLIDDGYVCSSKYMMEEYRKRPQDFSRQIIAEGSYADIRSFEAAILKSVNAALNEQFYNKHNGDSKFMTTKESHEKTTQKKKLRGDFLPENNPMYGRRHTEEVKQKHSKRMMGENNPNFGKKFSEEIKEGIVNGD